MGSAAWGSPFPSCHPPPFLPLAAACFSRSSRRLYDWLLGLRGFGPALRDFRAGRVVPGRAKLLALASLWLVVGLSLGPGMPPGWPWPRVGLLAVAGVGTFTILRLKTRR